MKRLLLMVGLAGSMIGWSISLSVPPVMAASDKTAVEQAAPEAAPTSAAEDSRPRRRWWSRRHANISRNATTLDDTSPGFTTRKCCRERKSCCDRRGVCCPGGK